jgi:general secretion pathway protein F
VEAPDVKGAAARLREMGYIPVRIRDAGGEGDGGGIRWTPGALFTRRVPLRRRIRFTQDLATLLSAGLPVDRALSTLIQTEPDHRFAEILEEVLKSVNGGSDLSDAMARHPAAFSSFYANMVRSGEAGGVLAPVMARIGEFLENRKSLTDEIVSALIYPAILLVVGGASVIVLLTYVIPKFAVIFADMGQMLPLSTRLLLAVSGFVRHWWWALAAVIIVLFIVGKRFAESEAGGRVVDRALLSLPGVGDLISRVEAARFARSFGTLIQSGVPILKSLTLVRETVGNRVVADALQTVGERLEGGERLSDPLAETGVFPPMTTQMIRVGEETGNLDKMLMQTAESEEKAIRTAVKRMIGLFEPAMILAMGLLVGFIVISMLTAVFSVNDISF